MNLVKCMYQNLWLLIADFDCKIEEHNEIQFTNYSKLHLVIRHTCTTFKSLKKSLLLRKAAFIWSKMQENTNIK